MQYPIDGNRLSYANTQNVILWTKQGTSIIIGGGFTTVSGNPSQQLLPSLNLTLGYFNGQMLANAVGDGTGRFANLTAGALINFDPASTDTGQAVWNGMIICDLGLKNPLPLLDPVTNQPFVYSGTIQVATQLQGWVIRQQYLYGSGTPATDIALVNTAIKTTSGVLTKQFQAENSSNSSEILFAY